MTTDRARTPDRPEPPVATLDPVVLGDGVRGWLHRPAAAVAASGTGVLLLPPLGWDGQTSHRPRRVWADRLAADGHAVLRIDLPGTGDAAGGPRDPDRLAAWTAAVADAVAWLRGPLGAARVAVVAVGATGLVALRAAAEGAAIDAAVLWGTPAKGRVAVRELQAFGRLEAPQTGEDPAGVPDGEVRAGGLVLPAATAAALRELDATRAAGPVPARVLLLGRDGAGPDPALAEALQRAGAQVALDPGAGWGAMTASPQQAAPPEPGMASVAAFLAAPPEGADAWPAPPAAEPLVGDGYAETGFTLDVDGVTVRGIVTAPPAGPTADVALFLNAGALHHVGPARLWVEAARRWAGHGVTSLRLDVEGIGDADGAPSPYADDLDLYVPALGAQTRAAMAAMAGGGDTRYALVGLCSGAYWAYHTAVADPRVRSALLLNPPPLDIHARAEDADRAERSELLRALTVLRRGGLARLRGATAPGRRLLALARSVPRLVRARLAGPAPAEDDLTRTARELHARGQQLTFAFSAGDEALRDRLEWTRAWPRLEAAGVRRRPLPLPGHTLSALAAQRAAHTVIDEALATAFQRPAPAAGSSEAPDARG